MACRLAIRDPIAVGEARRETRRVAAEAGFDAQSCEDLALVASELASNLVRHAGGGTLEVAPFEDGGRLGLVLETLDDGPGIPDPEQALVDGFSTAGSLGLGLGAVHRLVDELSIGSREGGEGGSRVRVRRFLRREDPPLVPLDVGVVSRPARSGDANGDAFVVRRWGARVLVGVIDGLGHGGPAHVAAEAARHYVDRHFDLPLPALFQGVDRTCRGTRGVVMALARVDLGGGRVQVGSVGNVSVRLVLGADSTSAPAHRGILGSPRCPAPLLTDLPWGTGAVLVLHSDGVVNGWESAEVALLAARSSAWHVASWFHTRKASHPDDATALVVKGDDHGR